MGTGTGSPGKPEGYPGQSLFKFPHIYGPGQRAHGSLAPAARRASTALEATLSTFGDPTPPAKTARFCAAREGGVFQAAAPTDAQVGRGRREAGAHRGGEKNSACAGLPCGARATARAGAVVVGAPSASGGTRVSAGDGMWDGRGPRAAVVHWLDAGRSS